MRTRILAAALVLVASASSADVLVLDQAAGHPTYLYALDSTADTLVLQGTAFSYPAFDLQPAADGYYYSASGAGSSVMGRARPDLAGAGASFLIPDTIDLAMSEDGRLVALDVNSFGDPRSAVWSLGLDGSIELVDSIPGFNMRGMDVPLAGPYMDGLVVIGYDAAPPNDFWLYRYRRLPGGGLDREGPFGPLEASEFTACRAAVGYFQEHLVVRCDGLSFLTKEGCSGRVLEHDLDGRFLGTFALIEDDPTVPDPTNPTAVFDDDIRAIHVTESDEVYVSTRRRLYHFDSDGVLIGKLPDLFRTANALGDSSIRTFAGADGGCRASGIGYWKRQCLTKDLTLPNPPRRNKSAAQPVGPGVHPAFTLAGLQAHIDLASRDLANFGVDACSALWPARPREWRSRALMHLAALYLDVESRRLGARCPALIDGTPTTLRETLQRIEAEIARGTDAGYREAVRLAVHLHGGVE